MVGKVAKLCKIRLEKLQNKQKVDGKIKSEVI